MNSSTGGQNAAGTAAADAAAAAAAAKKPTADAIPSLLESGTAITSSVTPDGSTVT